MITIVTPAPYALCTNDVTRLTKEHCLQIYQLVRILRYVLNKYEFLGKPCRSKYSATGSRTFKINLVNLV